MKMLDKEIRLGGDKVVIKNEENKSIENDNLGKYFNVKHRFQNIFKNKIFFEEY